MDSVTPDLTGFQQDEVCEVTGFESRKREECKEVRETECKEVEVTKFRMEIKQECKTKHDQACNITMKEVPSQECQPSIEEKYDFQIQSPTKISPVSTALSQVRHRLPSGGEAGVQ